MSMRWYHIVKLLCMKNVEDSPFKENAKKSTVEKCPCSPPAYP